MHLLILAGRPAGSMRTRELSVIRATLLIGVD
jgi:hypothetical protein